MNKYNTAIGFYQNFKTAQAVLKKLKKAGLRKSAAIQQLPNNQTETIQNSSPYLIFALNIAILIICALFIIILFDSSTFLIPILVFLALASIGGRLFYYHRCQIDRDVLDHYRRLIVSGETLIIVQVKSKDVPKALKILRYVESGHPISFLLRPEARYLDKDKDHHILKELIKEPLNSEQMNAQASALALSQLRVRFKKSREQLLLKCLKTTKQILTEIRYDVAEAEFLEQTVTASAEWLLDNTYVIQGNIEEIQKNLPKKYYQELPQVVEGPFKGLPRIYVIAKDIVTSAANRLNRENIIAYLNSYQKVNALTIGELWALPLMLRFRLVECVQYLAVDIDRRLREGEAASFWGNRLLNAIKNNPDKLAACFRELTNSQPNPSSHFAEELLDHIFDEEILLNMAKGWTDGIFKKNTLEIIQQEQSQKAAEQVALSNAIVSLITISQISWREIFEAISVVDQIFILDPIAAYPKMDFKTRDNYRHVVEKISMASRFSQAAIAKQALNLAEHGTDDVSKHVGYYLIDKGLPELESSVDFKPKIIEMIRRKITSHASEVYLGSIFLLTLLFEIFCVNLMQYWNVPTYQIVIITFLALIPASEFSIQILDLILSKLFTPFLLPQMLYDKGIPLEHKTLVVIPSLLSNEETINEHIQRLEIHYLANQEKALYFGLFVDFTDSSKAHADEDKKLMEIAEAGMRALEKKHNKHKFFLLYRERVWSEGEAAWIGKERKRGKLEALNRFLVEHACPEVILKVGEKEDLENIRFVITLDADTQLPKDTARQLVAAITHPLNAPKISTGGCVERGYTIIQPKVSTSFVHANVSWFTTIFSNEGSVDPYTQSISNIYQDIMHEGMYHGKGIYDVRAFHQILHNRFPEEHLLSHDLIEGSYVRVGFASDISLLDLFPEDYLTWSKRQHRWIRGDWQIIDWIFPKVPTCNKITCSNSLSVINRWKIFDNLRRSLVSVLSLAVLLYSWFFTEMSVFWTGAITLLYLLPAISNALTSLGSNPRIFVLSLYDQFNNFLRAIFYLTMIPHQSLVTMDAIARVFYRRWISHRHLLQWVTAYRSQYGEHQQFVMRLVSISFFAVLILFTVYYLNPSAIVAALPLCFLWLISPLVVAILDKAAIQGPAQKLNNEDRAFLQHIARKTWRYFDDFVGPQTNWLPPDNYQAALNIEVAQRTSPTNIGLWMLSVVSAYDLKFITIDIVIDKLLATFEVLQKMEQYEGHFLNWYDIKTLKPLYPRYVSTVDSGNFLGSLWTLGQAMAQMLNAPILPLKLLDGVKGTFSLMRQEMNDQSMLADLLALEKELHRDCHDINDLINVIRSSLNTLRGSGKFNSSNSSFSYWHKKLEEQLEEWNSIISRYFSWVDDLNELFEEDFLKADEGALIFKECILNTKFSLQMLASGQFPEELNQFINSLKNQDDPKGLVKKLEESIQKCRWLAGEKVAQAHAVNSALEQISNGLNMRFLYSQERNLFSIGYHIDERKLDNSYYDILASEARISSLVAIAKDDVPLEHWWSLGRSYNYVYGKEVLMSWGGTMFEYLMPLLFNHYNPQSLLGKGCKAAVDCQIIYGEKRGIPWGISEAAFSEIDMHGTYQYRSFGVPGLGFKRDLESDLVVSPYSTALALLVDPILAVKNLRRLSIGTTDLLSSYGYYESIDFARQHGPLGERGVTVYAYMAHHQGMSLIAINNNLNYNIMQNRFHADPRIAGVESLLFERVPLTPSIAKGPKKEIPISRLTPFSTVPLLGVTDTPHSATPKVNLLSNGMYSIMMTNAGGGYSKWKEFDITRWRADTTCDSWGSYIYIKDKESEVVWSSAYHPTYNRGKYYSVNFKAEKVEIKRRDKLFETLTEIVVSPEDHAEIRLLTLANLSDEIKELELTSYSELVLAYHNTDRQHPAFNKLFIETEALPELSALLAFRRLRSPHEEPIWAAHILATAQTLEDPLQYETDRSKFIGRGRSLSNPAALENKLSNTEGYVLDPIFSLRCSIKLNPGERVQVSFITAVAENREKVIELVKKYRDITFSHRAIQMAWTNAQLQLRHLRIHQEEAQLYQKLASRILYPHGQLRTPSERLKRCVGVQSNLWAYGISGDLPIVAVTVADEHDIDLVKQAITAHAFWHFRGLKVDLVILNEESSGYQHPLFDQLQRIIQSHSSHTEVGKSGGCYLINADQIPEEDVLLILSVARANLIAARGALRQQLVSPVEPTSYPPLLITKKDVKDAPSNPLPFMELAYFNGLGGYSLDGKEYVIYLGPGSNTPNPWINVLSNPQFGTMVSEAGLGCTWYGNSQSNRLTPWSNDPIQNPITDTIYIRDDEMGSFWTPSPGPIRELDAYRVSHGQGYSHFEHNSHGIEQELLIYVPVDEAGGEPLCIQKLKLRNASKKRRYLSLISYKDLILGSSKEETQMHVITDWDAESQAMFAVNRYQPDFGNHLAFAFTMPLTQSFSGNRTEFIGRNNGMSNPAGLKRKHLSGHTGGAYDPCVALQVNVEIDPGEVKEVYFILGYARDPESARKLIGKCREKDYLKQAFENTKAYWEKILGTIVVETPDKALNFSLNRWLLYQSLSCRYWGRSGFYQSSGAYGFRDQLQDVAALVYTAPHIAKEHILRAASHQFVEGDVQHWWHPISNGGVRTKITDDLLWLPYVTAQYVRVTKDVSILEESIPFLKGELLKSDQHEAYFIPEISEETGTLLEHCRRAIHKGITAGPHGLPLIGSGDWNDGMNLVGVNGKGESVWLGWFIIQVMNDFADLLVSADQEASAEGFRSQSKRLAQVIEEKGWDGKWYLRAFFDDGTPLGSHSNTEDFIDSLPQSWGVISGAAEPERAKIAMNSVEEHLVKNDDRIVLLLTPPFDKSPLDPGYIKGYPPGVRENGGQYTHGSLWAAMAFARQGEGDKAYHLLKLMHPSIHTRTPEEVKQYRVEPYAIVADIYSLQGQVGRGGWSWYTGAAAWMYRVWIEEMIGFKLRGEVLSFSPNLPKSWDVVKVNYTYKSTRYEISIENPQHLGSRNYRIEINGKEVQGQEIHLANDSQVHKVRVILV